MRDQDDGLAELAAAVPGTRPGAVARDRVDAPKGSSIRSTGGGGERVGDANARPLAARELRGGTVGVAVRVEFDRGRIGSRARSRAVDFDSP